MGVPLYSGMGLRIVILILLSIVALLCVMRYVRKVAKNPKNSILDPSEWLTENASDAQSALKEVALDMRSVIAVILFLLQPIVGILIVSVFKMGNGALAASQLLIAILIGLVKKFSFDKIGNAFAKGTATMAFVGFIIGCAATLSLVMTQGNIMHTIVYYACKPLQGMSTGIAAVGMSIVITFINLFIPSASAKVAVLCPILQPMCEMLGVSLQVGVQAFLYGDKLTNIISPVLGTTVAALALAKIPYNKYAKWVLPKLAILALVAWASLIVLSAIGWN